MRTARCCAQPWPKSVLNAFERDTQGPTGEAKEYKVQDLLNEKMGVWCGDPLAFQWPEAEELGRLPGALRARGGADHSGPRKRAEASVYGQVLLQYLEQMAERFDEGDVQRGSQRAGKPCERAPRKVLLP